MLVLVEDAAEAVAPSYVEAGYLVRICDRDGQWAHRAGVGDALVRSMGVVGLLELVQRVQRVQQVPLVPDQGPVEQLAAAGLHPSLHYAGDQRSDHCPSAA